MLLPLLVPALVLAQLAAGDPSPPAERERDAAPAASTAFHPATLAGPRPTLREIFAPPRLLGQRPGDASLSADGAFVLYRRAEEDAGEPRQARRHWWVVPAAGGAPRKVLEAPAPPPDDDDDQSDEDDEEEDARDARRRRDATRCEWTRHGATLLLVHDGWLETLDVAAGEGAAPEPLLEVGERVSRIHHFEDDRRIAFVAGEQNRLFVLDLASGVRTTPADALEDRGASFQVLEEKQQVAVFARPTRSAKAESGAAGVGEAPKESQTKDDEQASRRRATGASGGGGPAGGRGARVLWLVPLGDDALQVETSCAERGRVVVSADGEFAVRTESNAGRQRRQILADYLAEGVRAVPVRSDRAGDPAREVSLEIFDVARDEAGPAPLDQGERFWIADATFAPDGHRLLLHRVSNDSHVRQLLLVDPERRESRLLFAERDPAWIGGPLLFAEFSKDGASVLLTSERSGFNRLYRAPLDDGEPLCLSGDAGSAEVHAVELLEDGVHALIVTNAPDPAVSRIEMLDLESGERRPIGAADVVVARARASLNGTRVVWEQQFLGVPAELYAAPLAGNDTGAVRLTHTIPDELSALDLAPPELVSFTNPRDGAALRALLYRPEPFDPATRYPAVLFVHGAGYLQNVTRSMTEYPMNLLFHQRLARKGYVVLDVDYRHSKGYGRDFRTAIHGHMGGKDLDDLVAGVEWLVAQGLADRGRVGLYGGSYGGFLTLMALFTKPDVFAGGCALRSVTDWRSYNAWYTNPRLGDPVADAENYRRSSPIDHVAGLQRPLYLFHGLKDSNVFAQDSIRLVEKLVELGKDFECMLYPSQDHAFETPASWLDEYRRIERFFDEVLFPRGE